MPVLDRRTFAASLAAALAPMALGGCVNPNRPTPYAGLAPEPPPPPPTPRAKPPFDAGLGSDYAALYGPVEGEPFPIPAVNLTEIDRAFLRKVVDYNGPEQPGTIVIDPNARYLFLVEEQGRARRYGVGVGREGFAWAGAADIRSKQEWPDWYPPKEMIERQPEIRKQLTDLQGGVGMKGGPRNPLGARAMYLWQGNKDTLYRIHGTVEPWTIGKRVSSGCVRMINQDAIDLYKRVPAGTKVVVLGGGGAEVAGPGPRGGPGGRPGVYEPSPPRGYRARQVPPFNPADPYDPYWDDAG